MFSLVRLPGWVFGRLQRRLTTDGGLVVQLSGAEFRLLDVLISHAEEVLSRDRLVRLVQAPGSEAQGRKSTSPFRACDKGSARALRPET
jgi:DNA-binding response OmpR family regulator